MECRSQAEVVELLGPAASDALAADDRLRLDRHLADCSVCRGELIAFRRVARRLSVLTVADFRG